ncbi:MAG: hypothetical protein ACRD11_15150 [Terriglobia bacterium]
MDTPPNSVELISVGQGLFPHALKFTFVNVSGKTIIEFFVGKLHWGEGRDGFVTGGTWGRVAPGATMSMYFDLRELSTGGKLRVKTIFYDDGSGFGFGSWKARTEDTMLGEALETKRDADMLSARRGPSISGFDKVAAQIRNQPLDTPAEAVQCLRGITLPGISRAFIYKNLAHPSFYFRSGAANTRTEILRDIARVKSKDGYALAGSKEAQHWELYRRAHDLADLAKKYSSLSEWQVEYIKKAFQGAGQ